MSIAQEQELNFRLIEAENSNHFTPIVFLHGLMGFSSNWGKIWPSLQKERSILVFDQRGHGKSFKPQTGYDPTDYANDVLRLLDQMGWEKAHIVGHSMGGRVALRFCSLFPSRAKSLIIEDSGMLANPQRVEWINKLLSSIPTPFKDRESAKTFFEKKYASDPLLGGFLHTNLETKSNGQVDWRFYAPGMQETILKGRATDAMKEFSSLKLFTIVIRGEKSIEFPREEMQQMQAALPDCEFVEILGAGHFVHAEKPQEFTAALLDFLKKIER
jgi:esterase